MVRAGRGERSGVKFWRTYRLRLQRKRWRIRAWRKGRDLSPLQDRSRAIRDSDILLFATFRNENIRLPWFLQYYRDLGVTFPAGR